MVCAPVQASEFSYTIFKNAAEINAAQWDALLPADNLLLQREYLQSLEHSTGSEICYRYLLIEHNRQPVGLGYFQVISFKGSNVVNAAVPADAPWTKKLTAALQTVVVRLIRNVQMNLLVSGNAFVTGDYGFYFTPGFKKNPAVLQAVREGIDKIIAQCDDKISGMLVKDFYNTEKAWIEGLKAEGYLEFLVNPNMLLEIRPAWNTFEAYVGDMASKYRTRMKKARKRAAEIAMREMDAAELEQRLPELSALYDEVVDEADFKLAKLDIGYIVKLKKQLGEKFGVIGYFKGGELVTFISYYLHERDLVAGYMGLKRSLNHEYDLYLNVLLTLAETGIEKKMRQVVYGRTAMEIKSSVGALPHAMSLYVKHRSPVINFIIRRIVPFLSENPEWTLRSPFKEEKE